MKIGIIGGTGLYDPAMLEDRQERIINTPFGKAHVFQGRCRGRETVFLPRHGVGHTLLPAQVNYRANLMALKKLGVDRVLGVSAVGSLNSQMQPGHLVVCDQLVDFSKNRVQTFGLGHVDVTEPYCSEMRQAVQQGAAKVEDIIIHPLGTYVCFEGPRYETAAEIRMLQRLGMDVVGQTNIPEAPLARELGLCYGLLALVTNMGAGLTQTRPSHEAHREMMRRSLPKLQEVILETVSMIPEEKRCACQAQAVL
ncbi:MAG: MTAP family purine nucleoside phosphorylase [Chloroflexi bacterium]|nr:MTAP family purine nucleoside phosphorylase [Chloroflexota bacterium]